MKLARIRVLSLAAGLSVILMLSIAYAWPVQDTYHPRNLGWNGCSKIASFAENMKLLLSYDRPLPTELSLLAIIGPSVEFSRRESSNIRSFLKYGGTVLLADDFGTGNSLLEALEVPAKFSKKPLADLLYYEKEPSFPLIIDFAQSQVTVNVSAIVLNHPTYIEIRDSNFVARLALSSMFSFIDLNRDNRPEPNATIDSYPVLASASIGEGLLVLVSDPSMFMNEMIDLNDNMQLFRNLLEMGHDSLFLEVAHLGKTPLTDERMYLKDMINSVRDLSIFSKSGVYIQFLVVVTLILGFSFEIVRRVRERPTSRARKKGVKLYNHFRTEKRKCDVEQGLHDGKA